MATREETIKELARAYNNPIYFETDPIIFPKHFHLLRNGKQGIFKEAPVCSAADITLQDVEIAGLIAAHLAWGRRDMIVRDTKRAMDEMEWQPYTYVMGGKSRKWKYIYTKNNKSNIYKCGCIKRNHRKQCIWKS